MSYATTNPFTGEVVKTFPNATDAEVAQALDKAQAMFETWKDTAIAERVKVLQKAADLLRKSHTEYARILTLEMGKVIGEALTFGIVSVMLAAGYNWAKVAPSFVRDTGFSPTVDSDCDWWL